MEHERDRTIEKLLGDALRNGAASVAPGAQCLDAETAAAWIDGVLSERDRARVEGHVAGCERCQALAAALVRTAPPAPERASWFRVSRFAWLAPLTAAAAAVIVWAIMPPMAKSVAPGRDTAEHTLAETRPAPAAAPVPRADNPVGSVPATAQPAGGGARALDEKNARVADNEKAGKDAMNKAKGFEDRAQAEVAGELKKEGLKNEEAAKLNAAASRPAESAAAPAPAPPPAAALADAQAKRDADARAGAAAFATSPQGQSQVQLQTPSPSQQSSADSLRLRQSVAADSPAKAAPARREASPILVASPNPNQRWRVTVNPGITIVEHSTDAGRHWTPHVMDPGTVFSAGASPAPNVCWLVGPHGTVMLTTDGSTWQRIAFPEDIDLINVQATDDRNASMTAFNGRVFSTRDRGRGWIVPPPKD